MIVYVNRSFFFFLRETIGQSARYKNTVTGFSVLKLISNFDWSCRESNMQKVDSITTGPCSSQKNLNIIYKGMIKVNDVFRACALTQTYPCYLSVSMETRASVAPVCIAAV